MLIKFPYSRSFTKIEALVDYYCNVNKSPQAVNCKELSFRWNWPKSTVVDFVKYIESVKFAQENRVLFEFITKSNKVGPKPKAKDENQHPEPKEQLLFTDLLISHDIKHPFTSKFSEAWMKWMAHIEREHNKKYKSLETLQIAVNHLVERSNMNENMAIEMIDYSIAGNWATIHADSEIKRKYKPRAQKTMAPKDTPIPDQTPDTSWSK
jgi:hypothetical protein